MLDLAARWKCAQFVADPAQIESCRLTNFTERSLFASVLEAGFQDVKLAYCIDRRRAAPLPWKTFTQFAPHPWAPTLADLFTDRFSEEEQSALTSELRPLVEGGQLSTTDRMVYIAAVKP